MAVKIRLFAVLRERTGQQEMEMSWSGPCSVADIWGQLERLYPSIAPFRECVTFAVNREYVDALHPLSDGDELALIPPVSGGL